MKALLIVDVQNDFCPGGALGVEQGDRVAQPLNDLAPLFSLVVATQDYHPENHRSFASNNPGVAVGDVIDLNGVSQVMWPDHCVAGTNGARFHPSLQTDRINAVFKKGEDPEVDSYSGFFDNDHRSATGLEEFLKNKNVDHIYVGGIAADYCVKATVLDALSLGFSVTVIPEATRAVELVAGDRERALEEMRAAGCRMATAKEVHNELA